MPKTFSGESKETEYFQIPLKRIILCLKLNSYFNEFSCGFDNWGRTYLNKKEKTRNKIGKIRYDLKYLCPTIEPQICRF